MSINFRSLATLGAGDAATGSGVDEDLAHAQAGFTGWFHESSHSWVARRNAKIRTHEATKKAAKANQ